MKKRFDFAKAVRNPYATQIRGDPSAWIIRPYPHLKNRMALFLRRDIIAIGWPGVGDLTGLSREAILRRIERAYPKHEAKWHRQSRDTIVRFLARLEDGELIVVAPKKPDSEDVAIARVTSGYRYDARADSDEEGYPHYRQVRWITEGVPRVRLPDAVLRGIDKPGTLKRTDAAALSRFLQSAGLIDRQ